MLKCKKIRILDSLVLSLSLKLPSCLSKVLIFSCKKNRDKFPTGVVHSFTGDEEELKEILELDLYVGINGCSMKTEEN